MKCPNISVVPWQQQMTHHSVALLFSGTEAQQNQQTRQWREAKLQELSFVGLTSALITSAFTAGFTWEGISGSRIAVARGAWYCGLIISLASVTLATQQSIALHRLGAQDASMVRLRNALGVQPAGGAWEARKVRMLMWQAPVMMLNVSIFLFVGGLLIVVYAGFIRRTEGIEVAIMVSVALGFSVLCYLFATIALYRGIG